MMEKYFNLTGTDSVIRCKMYFNADDRGADPSSRVFRHVILFCHGFAGHRDNAAAQNLAGRILEKTADTEDVGLNALRIGDLALTFHSYELFGTSAQWLLTGTSNATDPATGTLTGETRTASPFGANTFVVSHANGAKGYIPHAEAYDYNCYESYVSNVGSTAEKAIHDHMIAILQSLKN